MTLHSWYRRAKRAPRKPQPAVGPRRFRPNLEQLEEREVPSAFFVSTLGNDANPGTSTQPFRTIQAGINAAALTLDGNDTVNVAGGTYSTAGVDLAINIPADAELTNLQLLGGWNSTFTTRNPADTPTNYIPQNTGNIVAFDVTVADSATTVDGFAFVFDGTPGAGGARQSGGILVSATNVTLNSNILEVASSSTATANDAYAVQTLFNSDVTGLTISNNTITASATNAGGAFYLNPGTNTGTITVSGNTISGSNLSSGITVEGISNVMVSDNALSRTGPAAVGFSQLIYAGPFSGAANQSNVTITRNTLDSNGGGAGVTVDDSVGIEIGNTSGNGLTIANVTVSENTITDNEVGILVSPGVVASSTTVRGNSITGNTTGLARLSDPGNIIDASGNWWGNATGPTIASNPSGTGNTIAGSGATQVDYSPWLTSGTDTAPATNGFQGDLSLMTVNAGSPINNAQGATGNLQDGVNRITAGGTLIALAGTYGESVAINKALTLSPNGGATGAVTLTGASGASTLNGATLLVDLTNTPSSDLLQNNANTLTLTGASLQVSAASTSSGGQVFTIISSPGGISGTFNGLADGSTFTAANGRVYRISYSATSVTLTLPSPTVTANPSSRTINAGGTATFTAAATDPNSSLTVQWQYSTNGGASWSNLGNGGNFSGATTTALTVSGALTNLNGYYFRAVFTNADGLTSATSAATLTVNSLYAYAAYAYTYYAYSNAYYAYVTGGGSYAYQAYLNAAYAYQWSAYAYYYSSIGNAAAAASCAYYAYYYSYVSSYYSAYAYAQTRNVYAYYAWYNGYYAYSYSSYMAAGY